MRITELMLRSLKERLDRTNSIEDGARLDRRAWISGSQIGPNVEVAEGCKIYKSGISGRVLINRFTSLWGPDVFIYGSIHGVEIGAFCSIAHHVSIHESFHDTQRTTTYFIEKNLIQGPRTVGEETSKGKIVIGNDVWIGTGSTLLSGVSIGNGAIIGAGSVVSRDIPPYVIAAGCPAKVIRARFKPNVVQRLEDSQWWNWSEEKLKQEKEFLTQIHEKG